MYNDKATSSYRKITTIDLEIINISSVIESRNNSWFACDVIAAMLAYDNSSVAIIFVWCVHQHVIGVSGNLCKPAIGNLKKCLAYIKNKNTT